MQGEQLSDKRTSDTDRMTATASVRRDDKRGDSFADCGRKFFERRVLNAGMIHRHEHDGASGGGQSFESALQRAKHASLWLGIHNERNLGDTLNSRSNL